MQAYHLTGKAVSMIGLIRASGDERLRMEIHAGGERYFRHVDLNRYGLKDSEIEALCESNMLEKTEISREKAIGLAHRHKYRQYVSYQLTLLRKLRKAKENNPILRRSMHRREMLYDRVLIPDFSVCSGSEYILVKSVCSRDVEPYVRAIRELVCRYPGWRREKYQNQFLMRLEKDIKSFGIRLDSKEYLRENRKRRAKLDKEKLLKAQRLGNAVKMKRAASRRDNLYSFLKERFNNSWPPPTQIVRLIDANPGELPEYEGMCEDSKYRDIKKIMSMRKRVAA